LGAEAFGIVLVQCVLALFIGMRSVIAAYQGLTPVGTATLLGTGSLGVIVAGRSLG